MQRGHLIMFLLNSVASCQSNTTRFRDNQRPLLAAPEGAGTMVLLTPPAGDKIMLHCCIIAQLHLKIQPPYWPNSNLKAVYPPSFCAVTFVLCYLGLRGFSVIGSVSIATKFVPDEVNYLTKRRTSIQQPNFLKINTDIGWIALVLLPYSLA